MSEPRPQLRAYWDGEDDKRHQRHTLHAEREKPEPYFAVYAYSLRNDCTDGDPYQYWDGDCLEYVTEFGRRVDAKFVTLDLAREFARDAWNDRALLAGMHNVLDAAVLVVSDQDGKEYDRLPLFKVVPKPAPWSWLGWWWKLFGL